MLPSEYGIFNVYNSWLDVITIFITLNLSAGVYNTGMVKFKQDRLRFTSALQGLSTLLTLACFGVYLLFCQQINRITGLTTFMMTMMFIELLFIPAINFWTITQRFKFRYIVLVVVSVLMALLNSIFGIIAVHISEQRVEARIFAITLVQVVFGAFFYILNSKRGKTFFHRYYWQYALSFSIPLIPHYLSGKVLSVFDRIMISKLGEVNQVAYYSMAYNIALIVNIIVGALNNAFSPWYFEKLQARNYKRINEVSRSLMLVVAWLVIMILLVAPEIVKVLAPPEYQDALSVLPPVAVSTLLTFTYGLFVKVEFYFESSKSITVASGVGAILNIILNIALIPIFGYLIAAYTTLISYAVMAIMHYCAVSNLCRKRNINVRELFSSFYYCVVSAGTIFIAEIISRLYGNFMIRYAFVTISLVLCLKKRNLIKQLLK